jgi:Acetyltransferase (GNAT) domain
MADELQIKILRAISELESIREVWESWPGNRDSHIDSFIAFLRSNPGSVRPHVVVVSRAGAPEAILVGRIDLGQISCRLGYLKLNLPAKILCFVYGAFRGNPSKENSALIVDSILQSLSDREADVAYMNFLRQDSDLCHLAMNKPGLLSRDYIQIMQPHFAATLPATTEEFYRSLSPKVRKNLKWQAKKLVEHFSGAVRIDCYSKPTELEKMIQDVEEVAKRSYQRGLGVGFIGGPKTLELLRFKAERGWLRAYILYLADRPCAFWIGDINENTFGSDCLAYDGEYAKYSPGMFLILKVIEGFCDGNRDGITAVDFGTGHAQYKEVLSSQEWHERSIYVFGPTLKGVGLNLTRTLIDGPDQAIKRALAHTNLLQIIKKHWRAHVTVKEANT